MNSLVPVVVRDKLPAMRGFLFSVLAGLCLWAAEASAQLAVSLRLERDMFLLYESIPVVVNVGNYSGRTIELKQGDNHPSLDFMVAHDDGSMVPRVNEVRSGEMASLPPGQTLSRKVDLLPLYELREPGAYRVQAIVESGGYRAMSTAVHFSVTNGRELWSQTIGLPVKEDGPDEYRTYSLMIRRDRQYDIVYACVRDQPNGLVYGMLPIGVYVPLGSPDVRVDKGGDLFVLHRSGPRSFTYTRVSPFGKILDQAVYSDIRSQPRLEIDSDGIVLIVGGEKTYPRPEHVMTDQELKPPPPAPPPPPKRKWWWPFGPGKAAPPPATTPEQTSTNAPAQNFSPRG